MESRTFWYQLYASVPLPSSVFWLGFFLQLAAFGNLIGLLAQPCLFRHSPLHVITAQHALLAHQASTTPCTTQIAHRRIYTSQQILDIRPAPLDPSLVTHLRDLGIGYHLTKRRSTRGGRRKRRKIEVIVSNRHDCVDNSQFHNNTEGDVTLQRPRPNLVPVPMSTKEKVDNSFSKQLRIGTFNAQSLGPTVQHKRVAVAEFVKDNNVDILFIQETWFREKGSENLVNELAPSGYTAKSFPRSNFGGGLAVIFKDSLTKHIGISLDFDFAHTTFELCQLVLIINNKTVNFFNIYRTCPSSKNKFTANSFSMNFTTS